MLPRSATSLAFLQATAVYTVSYVSDVVSGATSHDDKGHEMQSGNRARLSVALVIFSLTNACSNGISAGNEAVMNSETDHFRCAALISAADALISAGTVVPDPEIASRELMAVMSHLNAYAIPQKISELDAMVAVKAEREKILASLSPASTIAQAKACIART